MTKTITEALAVRWQFSPGVGTNGREYPGFVLVRLVVNEKTQGDAMKRARITITVLALAFVAISGCSDDNGNPVVCRPQITHLVVGHAILRPYVDFSGNIHPIFGRENEIDSVVFGDARCTISKYSSFVEGNNYTYGFTYYNMADSMRFHSGDTVQITFFKGSEIASTSIKLLAIRQDTVSILSPPNSSILSLDEDVTLVWRRVGNADWYSVYYTYDTSRVFGAELRQVYDFTTDTTYTIPAETHTDDGAYRIFVGAVTGPVPGTDGNVQSESMTGSIYGWAVPGVREGWEIIIGSGPAGAVSASYPERTPNSPLLKTRQ